MNATEVYKGFIAFEERSADLYLKLSIRFAENPDIRWFWVEMAMEEKQHAGMLQHCREAGVFSGQLPDDGQIQKLDHLFTHLADRIGAADLSLDDAFDIAIRLESSEINNAYDILTAPIEGPAHVMRKKIELSVECHFQKLLDAAERLGASAETQARLARLAASERISHDGVSGGRYAS